MPVGDLGLPMGYINSKSEIRKAVAESEMERYK
jgi:hypothetical protein